MSYRIKTAAASMMLMMFSLQANAADAVAVVNGKEISQEMYQMYVKQLSAKSQGGNIDRNRLINELVNRELLHQAAQQMKLEQDPTIKFMLEQQSIDLLSKAAMKAIVDKSPITEGEIEETYKQLLANGNPSEFKARHILLKNEDDAKSVIKELDKGADFAKLAKEKSTGPSASSGGDLGWFKPSQMVPPFSKAVIGMDKGTYSKTPVQTQFGWHVIKLEDIRKVDPPKLADVKDQIRNLLQQQRVQKYVADMRQKGKIEIK